MKIIDKTIIKYPPIFEKHLHLSKKKNFSVRKYLKSVLLVQNFSDSNLCKLLKISRNIGSNCLYIHPVFEISVKVFLEDSIFVAVNFFSYK